MKRKPFKQITNEDRRWQRRVQSVLYFICACLAVAIVCLWVGIYRNMKDGGGFEGSGTRGAVVAEGATRAGDAEDAATDSARRAAAKAANAAATPAAPGTAIFAEPGPALGAAQSAKQS
ncbi:MAG: hypothetical protein LBU58_05385, partial [Clostridiales bacterium]|nr:hypothetical protein [Clostridiales bacterium]